MECLAGAPGVLVGVAYLLVLLDGAVLDGVVDLYEILIDDAAGADIEVSNFAVSHLSVGQTDVLAAGLKLAVGVGGEEVVPVGCGGDGDDVVLLMVAEAPSVENHE